MIVRPVCSSHSQVRSTNASRPSSCRVVPSATSCFSTTFCVEIPAWSYPGCQSVSIALHPVPADEHVLERAVQRVAHVQLAGHVRRRHAIT